MEEAHAPISPNASNQEDTISTACPASQVIGQKLVTNDSADVHAASYVEDLAWRELSMDDPSVDKLPVLLPPDYGHHYLPMNNLALGLLTKKIEYLGQR